MPRPPRDNSTPRVSPGQASWVLDRLIAERRISAGEVSRYVNDMQREISDLEQRLQSLREAHGSSGSSGGSGTGSGTGSFGRGFGGGAQQRRGPGRPAGSGAGRPGRPAGSGSAAASSGSGGGTAPRSRSGAPRRANRPGRTPITAEQLASRQLQGRYLGLIRQIPANKRAPYQRTAKERGREAAIKEMQNALGK